MRNRILIEFKGKSYEMEVNKYDSLHHIINDLFYSVLQYEINFIEYYLLEDAIENKCYILYSKTNKIQLEQNTCTKNNDIMILVTEDDSLNAYFSFVLKYFLPILLLCIIIFFIKNILRHFFLHYFQIEYKNKLFELLIPYMLKLVTLIVLIIYFMGATIWMSSMWVKLL